MPMDARGAIGKGLDLYRDAMRDFIRETLQVEYGESWFSAQVAPLLYGNDWRLEHRLKAVLKRGLSAEVQIDIGEFARVIQEFGDLFPEPIRRGQHHHSRLGEIAEVRNIHVHATQTLYKADAEKVLGACKEVLSLCGRESAAKDVDGIIRSLDSATARDEPSRVADSTDADAIATKSQAAPEPIGKIGAQILASLHFRAGFLVGVGLLISGLVVVFAFLVLQRDDSAVGSTQEQATVAATAQETSEIEDRDSNSDATSTAAGNIQEPVVDDVTCSPWPPSADQAVTCTAKLSGGEPDAYSWSGGDSVGSSATFTTHFGPSPVTTMIFLEVHNSAGNASAVLFGTWFEQRTTTASDMLSWLPGVDSIYKRFNGQLLRYGVIDGLELPGSRDFIVRTGDILVFNFAEGDSENRLNVVSGRIIMRVEDRTDVSGEDDWRIEVGFLPEWAMKGEFQWRTAIETWSDLLPLDRYVNKNSIEQRAADDDRGWVYSSRIAIPTQPAEASEPGAAVFTGRVTVRYSPVLGRLRIEFGFLPDWRVAEDGILLPLHGRFVREWTIANRRNTWLRSSVIEVPMEISSRSGFYARCGSDTNQVYWFSNNSRRKHLLNLSSEQATQLLGPDWWSTILQMDQSGCDRYPTDLPLTADDHPWE